MHLNFLGLFNFTAPYLPWVLLAFSVTLRSNAVVDLLGIVAGGPLSHSVSHLMLRTDLLSQLISAAVTPGKMSRERAGHCEAVASYLMSMYCTHKLCSCKLAVLGCRPSFPRVCKAAWMCL